MEIWQRVEGVGSCLGSKGKGMMKMSLVQECDEVVQR